MPDFGLRLPDPAGLLTDTILGEQGANAPAVVIIELTGEQRTIELRGRALPYRLVGWGMSMRTKITWYQGNPIATQQVLGPELPNTVMEGMWKDRFMRGAEANDQAAILVNGDPNTVRTAEDAVALFYELCQSGNDLKVIWSAEVRTGVLVDFLPTYERPQDIQWRLEFEWTGRNEGSNRPFQEPITSEDLLASINSLDDILGFSPEDVTRAFNAQLLSTVDSVRERVGEVFEVLRTVEAAVSLPGAVVGKILAAVESIRLELTEEIGRLTESAIAGGDEPVSVTVRPDALFRVEAYRRTTARRAAGVRSSSFELGRQTQERATPRQVQIVFVKEDSSLYALSSRFYGTPDYATFLASANGLTSAIAPAGFQLRVPPRPAAADDGQRAVC